MTSDASTSKKSAASETRTRDPDLGKVVLYQLSYCRISVAQQINELMQFLIAGAKVLLFLEPTNLFPIFFILN